MLFEFVALVAFRVRGSRQHAETTFAPHNKILSRNAVQADSQPPKGDAAPEKKALPTPNAAEQRAIAGATKRRLERVPRLQVDVKQNDSGAIDVFGATHSDHHGWLVRLEDAFGTRGQAFAISQLNQLMSVCRDTNGKYDAGRINGMIAAVEAARPANEIEASLAVQMAVTHDMALQALRRAARVDQIPQYDSAGNMATKLLRTYTMQVESLTKLQRGGQQVVKVVHVHPGAQAVVGNVTTSAKGPELSDRGGGTHENFHQPHAKAELPAPSAEPLPEMWSGDAMREPLPLAGSRR